MNQVKSNTKAAVSNVANKLADIVEYFSDLVDASISDYNRFCQEINYEKSKNYR